MNNQHILSLDNHSSINGRKTMYFIEQLRKHLDQLDKTKARRLFRAYMSRLLMPTDLVGVLYQYSLIESWLELEDNLTYDGIFTFLDTWVSQKNQLLRMTECWKMSTELPTETIDNIKTFVKTF